MKSFNDNLFFYYTVGYYVGGFYPNLINKKMKINKLRSNCPFNFFILIKIPNCQQIYKIETPCKKKWDIHFAQIKKMKIQTPVNFVQTVPLTFYSHQKSSLSTNPQIKTPCKKRNGTYILLFSIPPASLIPPPHKLTAQMSR